MNASCGRTGGMQNPPVRPRALVLVTTHQCTAACDHCCFACSPKVTKAIPVPRLHRLIDEAARVPSIERITFTGGECFLLGDELARLVERAAGHGLRTRCVTNAYWAVNEKGAAERLRALRAAGLSSLSISTGFFHARYVPVERVVLAARTSAKLGIATGIYIEHFAESAFDARPISSNRSIKRYVANRRIRIEEAIWMPNQGGFGQARFTQPPELSRARKRRQTRCSTVLDTVAVNPDQTLFACCGLPMEYVDALQMCSVAETPLDEALASARADLMKMWLHVEGPEKILEFVRSYEPDYTPAGGFAHICESCTYLHRDPVVKRVLAEHAGEAEQRVRAQYAQVTQRGRAAE